MRLIEIPSRFLPLVMTRERSDDEVNFHVNCEKVKVWGARNAGVAFLCLFAFASAPSPLPGKLVRQQYRTREDSHSRNDDGTYCLHPSCNPLQLPAMSLNPLSLSFSHRTCSSSCSFSSSSTSSLAGNVY